MQYESPASVSIVRRHVSYTHAQAPHNTHTHHKTYTRSHVYSRTRAAKHPSLSIQSSRPVDLSRPGIYDTYARAFNWSPAPSFSITTIIIIISRRTTISEVFPCFFFYSLPFFSRPGVCTRTDTAAAGIRAAVRLQQRAPQGANFFFYRNNEPRYMYTRAHRNIYIAQRLEWCFADDYVCRPRPPPPSCAYCVYMCM